MSLTNIPKDIENIINNYVCEMNHIKNNKKILPKIKSITHKIEPTGMKNSFHTTIINKDTNKFTYYNSRGPRYLNYLAYDLHTVGQGVSGSKINRLCNIEDINGKTKIQVLIWKK